VAVDTSATKALGLLDVTNAGIRISNPNEFALLGDVSKKDKDFALSSDIDLEDSGIWIGPENYSGHFYGNGYTIKNLVLQPSGSSSNRNLGLFKSVRSNAEIKDFTLEVSTVNETSIYAGGIFFGGVVGTLPTAGTGGVAAATNVIIEKVVVKGTLAIGGTNDYLDIGGVIGVMEHGTSVEIKRCVSELDIALNGTAPNTKTFCSFGGLVGTTTGILLIENSYATGTINVYHNSGDLMLRAGGFVGSTWKGSAADGGFITINNSYTAGTIIAEKNSTTGWSVSGSYTELSAGGFLGSLSGDANDSTITISNSAALNGSVLALCSTSPTTTYGSFGITRANYGRLIGSVFNNAASGVSVSGNIALESMKLGYTTPGSTFSGTSDANGREGETVTAETLKTPGYWTTTLNWDANIWDFSKVSTGSLPTLK
ncbi:MAG: hypothetical protein LBD22_00795, partial [Spirochaetaceae bacterium]|jgi:hypothetical protein|nr:hypothetical protein [Spirochaetaceae bacterium]